MATPAWFDYETYMNNKLAQLQETDSSWTMEKLLQTLADSGFNGADGAYNHFVTYGADEDVAPNAYFDADEYYYFKTIEYYNLSEGTIPSEFQINVVKDLIDAAGLNAWTHYVAYGSSEGVNTSVKFNAEAYCADKAAIMNENGSLNNGEEWTAESMANAIHAAGYTILGHYMEFKGTGNDEVASTSAYSTNITGQEFTLTTDKDTPTATNYDDTFIAGVDNGNTTLNGYDIIDGMAGTDTLILNDGVRLAGNISNVEKLIVNEEASSSSYNLANYSFDTVTFQNIDTPSPSSITVNGVNGQSIVVDSASEGLTVGVGYAEKTEVADLVNDSSSEAVTFTINSGAKLETVNLRAINTEAETTLSFGNNLDALNVNLEGTGTVTVTPSNLNAKSTIDATALEGKLTISSPLSKDITVKIGDGDSAIQVGAKAKIYGGDGEDVYTLASGVVAEANDPLSSLSDIATIYNFADGQDSIKTSGISTINYTQVSGTSDALSYINEHALVGAASSVYAIGDNANNCTYIVVNGANASTIGTGDMIVKLQGVLAEDGYFSLVDGIITVA